MIDKITITVDETGKWWMNAGDVTLYHTNNAFDLLKEVKGQLDNLGFFYPPSYPLHPDPIPFSKLPEAVSKTARRESEKERKSRLKAEKHFDELRQESRAIIRDGPPANHSQELHPGRPNGVPANPTGGTSQAERPQPDPPKLSPVTQQLTILF